VGPAAEAAQAAATQQGGASAGQQAYDLIHGIGTSAVVDALNHITLIAMVVAFVSAALSFVLIRQQDFVVRGGPAGDEPAAAEQVG
jgi:hypothetical protein